MIREFGRIPALCVIFGATIIPVHPTQPASQGSAWEALLCRNPAAAEDSSIGWRERLILYALTPEQAEAYFQRGADPQSLLLQDGRTLEQFLDAKLSPPAAAFVPLPGPCALFSSDRIEAGRQYAIRVRGEDLGEQGGSASGCGVPAEATAVILRLRVKSVSEATQVKLWAGDGPEPPESLIDTFDGSTPLHLGEFIATLASEARSEGDLLLHSTSAAALSGDIVGYFRALRTGDTPPDAISFHTEGPSRNFFGDGAGASNTTGYSNNFFGANAGYSNTTGNANSFFGHFAGYGNVSGSYNSIFGNYAGYSNTGNGNTFLGDSAGYYNSSGSQNAFVGRTAGGLNQGGADNAFFGYRAGYSNVSGNQNLAAGSEAGDNATGSNNSFVGYGAGHGGLGSGNSASDNSFFGAESGYANSTGNYNAFFGRSAGFFNTTGSENAFFGRSAGYHNTTGDNNACFGDRAGYNNTEGYNNAFFGKDSGYSNTLGQQNTFIGRYSGYYNTEGIYNTFVGRSAGIANTVESYNSFLGGFADGAAAVTNGTAVGFRAKVSQSNSLVLGSINGVNSATADVKVGIGTTAPQEALHVVRSNGTAMIKVEETSGISANRVLFRLTNNGAPWFKLLNSATAQEWTFAMDQFDNFIFSRIGTGGAEFKIYKDGTVAMGPGGSEVFRLQPDGALAIDGNLTAAGVTYVSDRERKEHFTAVDTREILEKVAALEISRWNFREDPAETPHLSPTAQDFHAAFGLGGDGTTISASDISGVALAAIQGLHRKLEVQEERLAAQQAEIGELRAQLQELIKTRGAD